MKLGSFEFDFKKIFQSPRANTKELGATGTYISDGYISNEDYVPKLDNITTAVETYDEMRKSDGVVKAALLACTLPIRASKWFVQPASDDEKDKEVAEFVETCLFDKMTITWDDFLRQALTMLDFGFSVFEKVFCPVVFNGKQMIGLKKLAPRLQRTILRWKTESGEDGITQQLPTGPVLSASIPSEKLLLFTHQKEGDNYTGISILRSAYRPWYFKKTMEKVNAIGFERQGLGIPYAKMPQNYTKKDYNKAVEILKNIRANEQAFIIETEGWEIGFKDMKAKTVKTPDHSFQRFNREILISVLAQFLDLGAGPYGSRALSADQSSTFHNNLTAIANQICDIMNRYLIKQLVDLNYNVDYYPELRFSNIGIPQYETLSKSLASLIQNQAIKPDEQLEDYLRNLMNLPERPEDDLLEESKSNVKQEKPKQEKIDEEEKMSEKIIASEFKPFRELTFAEKNVNFPDVQKKMEQSENRLRITLDKILAKTSSDLIRKMQLILNEPNNKNKKERLNKLAIGYKGEYRKELLSAMRDMFQYGKTTASGEMKKPAPTTSQSSISAMSAQADNLTETMSNDMMKVAKLALLVGLQQKKPIGTILGNISRDVKKKAKETSLNTAGININNSINQGRREVFNYYKNDIYALQRSEILDSVTCNYCMSIDNRVYRKNDPFTSTDAIHSNCRGIWVEISKESTVKPKITGMPKSLKSRFQSINNFEPPKKPIIAKKTSEEVEMLKTSIDRLKKITNENL